MLPIVLCGFVDSDQGEMISLMLDYTNIERTFVESESAPWRQRCELKLEPGSSVKCFVS